MPRSRLPVVLVGISPEEAAPQLRELERAGREPACELAADDRLGELVADAGAVVIVRGGDRVVEVGEQTARIAHELRNVALAPLAMQVELAERAQRLGNHERARELLAETGRLVRYGELAIDRVLRFGRQVANAPLERAPAIVEELADRAIEVASVRLARTSGPAIAFERERGAAGSVVDVDAGEVIAALVSLVVNAIEALTPAGGHVIVRTAVEHAAVVFEVNDDGRGIAPELRERVFEPFFTTKGDAGTGLGLSVVDACMRRHGGEVELASTPGAGTRVRLWFPASGAEAR